MIENKDRIFEEIRKHPEGLTIMCISKNTKISRVTASKYIMVLLAEGMIEQRMVGTAKLCYPRK
jgi:response regulator of citrate/malate metabolism